MSLGIEPSEHFAGLLREDFGVAEIPGDAPPFVDKQHHLKLATRLKGEGYRIFVYVVATHFLESKDDPEHYEVAYGLRRPAAGAELAAWRVRLELGEAIDSLARLFAGADWQEREQYDLVGVNFAGHPDLRRLMMPEDWEGYPLRKDYAIETACSPWR